MSWKVEALFSQTRCEVGAWIAHHRLGRGSYWVENFAIGGLSPLDSINTRTSAFLGGGTAAPIGATVTMPAPSQGVGAIGATTLLTGSTPDVAAQQAEQEGAGERSRQGDWWSCCTALAPIWTI